MQFPNITAVCVNWLQARNTLGAIDSFRKFYPDMKLMVVDDASDKEDYGVFVANYGAGYKSEHFFDPDTDTLKRKDVQFVQLPPYVHTKSGNEGRALELAMKKMKTPWMLSFHSDFRFLKPGLVELMASHISDDVCAIGCGKTKHPLFPALDGIVSLFNVSLGKDLTMEPVYWKEGVWERYTTTCRSDGFLLGTGAYYTGTLHQRGFKVVDLPWGDYGIHLSGGLDEKVLEGVY